MPPAAAAAEEKDAGLLLGWARGVTAALLVMMRKMMCGRQSGAYVVFGGEEQEEGRSSLAAKVLGPRLQLFHDTNDLLVRTLFSKSDLAPATSSFQQVGGHAGAFKASKAEDGTNRIAKAKDAREHAFYEHVTQAMQHAHPTHAWPARFMPAYYGETEHNGCSFINIENLLDGYTRPCIMDLKMGVRTAEATAPLQKRVRMKAADILTSCQSDGVQLIAMSVYQRSQHKQVKTSKKASALFSSAFNMEQVLAFFLSGGDGKRISHHLLDAYLSQLRELLVGLEANRTYSFIGSSLLFIHDGTGLKRQRRPRIRMIDFAHVHTADQDTAEPADPGYITGLQTLIRALEVVRGAKALKSEDMEDALSTVMLANRWRHNSRKMSLSRSMEPPSTIT